MNHIRRGLPAGLFGLVAAMLGSGCAATGWQGAEAEKAYDKDLEIKRLAEVRNNDDYYEIHRDGRIYVLSDAGAYRTFLATDEIPLVVTRIGAGPGGETVRLALTKNEAKQMEKTVGFQGAAQKMFEGTLPGLEKGFYGQVQLESGEIYVFDRWQAVQGFRQSRQASGQRVDGAGPKGEAVTFVSAAGKPAELIARFQSVHGKKQ